MKSSSRAKRLIITCMMKGNDYMPHIDKQMVSFFLTTKCNLKCVYCYNSAERDATQQSLSLEIAKAGIDYFFANNTSRHIRFYGPGEPTQEFELMCEITNYARSKTGKNLTSEIQTNGVFGHKIREWMLNNINIIWVSFDGEPEIHDANRPCANGKPSSPIIENNVQWLIDNSNARNLMVGARVTMTNKNLSRQKEIINYFHSLGIRNIWTDPLFPAVDNIPVCLDQIKKDEFSFNMDKYIDNYLEALTYAKTLNVQYGSFLACNFDGITNYHCRTCTPVPHITPDGYLSACDMVTLGENAYHMSCFVYGKWNSETNEFDFYEDKIMKLQKRSAENMQHCMKCRARLQCGGYCLGEVVNETGDLLGQKPQVCKGVCRLYDELQPPISQFEYTHP